MLKTMSSMGGRDTVFGQSGRYLTRMSKLHANEECPTCGDDITKEAYMGGSIYYCLTCQKF
ncbi:MAG: hypothetical protein KMY55_07110 [Dethiosulfatibacter sp.]|nr:hypothetical protein [Dethiosulfatibacter sp.]